LRWLCYHFNHRGSFGFKGFLLGPDLIGCFVPMSLAKPRRVVLRRKGGERCAKLLNGFEVAHPEKLLFEGPYRPLGHAISLRLPDECR